MEITGDCECGRKQIYKICPALIWNVWSNSSRIKGQLLKLHVDITTDIIKVLLQDLNPIASSNSSSATEVISERSVNTYINHTNLVRQLQLGLAIKFSLDNLFVCLS